MLKEYDVAIVNGMLPLRFRPVIAVNHGLTLPGNILYRKVIVYLYRRVDKVVCVSQKLSKELEEIGIKCDHIIPPPLKLDLYKPSPSRENIVVHIGGSPVKNPEISVRAVEILNNRGINVKLYIIGKEGMSTEHVRWLGNVDAKTVREILCKAKALIHPSSYEAFPLAVAEAMACGTPVAVSPAVPEELVIDGYNGLRINTWRPEDYAEALEKLLSDDNLWSRLSQKGVETVKGLDHIEIAKKYIQIAEILVRG